MLSSFHAFQLASNGKNILLAAARLR